MAKITTKKKVVAFHQELSDLLSKYNLLPEDGKLNLITSQINFSANNLLNCPPECQMTKVVTLPNGQTTIMTFCDPNCH
ncbi:hypothetical protein [Flavobacterium sp. LC2016-01]|uniref:hypothetical protein n=1 Tax=Flavobacterium sp. LC2016-01 TaxID=2675876 RepID=UPI0012BB007B|nr:hypothetical protein [Flavobacterium sp. LC2016-01]MTH15819.1 hypothetical protein [Flavobacterium sp. LC2016-01]